MAPIFLVRTKASSRFDSNVTHAPDNVLRKALAHRNLHQFDGPLLVVWPEDNSPGAHGNVTDDALCPKAHRVEVLQAAVTVSRVGIWPRGNDENYTDEEDRAFQELRRKIREAKVLCPTVESLLEGVRFTGRLSVVVQNGKILKSGYEEGYFTRRQDERWSADGVALQAMQ